MKTGLTRINSVKVVQVRSKAESFDTAFDVAVDVLGRVGDPTSSEDIEPALGCD